MCFHEGKAVLCPMGNAMNEYNECNIYGINKNTVHNTFTYRPCCIVTTNILRVTLVFSLSPPLFIWFGFTLTPRQRGGMKKHKQCSFWETR